MLYDKEFVHSVAEQEEKCKEYYELAEQAPKDIVTPTLGVRASHWFSHTKENLKGWCKNEDWTEYDNSELFPVTQDAYVETAETVSESINEMVVEQLRETDEDFRSLEKSIDDIFDDVKVVVDKMETFSEEQANTFGLYGRQYVGTLEPNGSFTMYAYETGFSPLFYEGYPSVMNCRVGADGILRMDVEGLDDEQYIKNKPIAMTGDLKGNIGTLTADAYESEKVCGMIHTMSGSVLMSKRQRAEFADYTERRDAKIAEVRDHVKRMFAIEYEKP